LNYVKYTPVGFWITSDLGDDLDSRGLVGSVSHGPSHLLMSERLGGVRPEGELGAEHGLEKEDRSISQNGNTNQKVIVTLLLLFKI
jgi:hypothetical protein